MAMSVDRYAQDAWDPSFDHYGGDGRKLVDYLFFPGLRTPNDPAQRAAAEAHNEPPRHSQRKRANLWETDTHADRGRPPGSPTSHGVDEEGGAFRASQYGPCGRMERPPR